VEVMQARLPICGGAGTSSVIRWVQRAAASLSMGKAALRSAQTLIAAGVWDDGIHAATITIAGAVKPGTHFDPDNIAALSGPPIPTRRTPGRPCIGSQAHSRAPAP
jgi:hypothetical protein